MKKLSSHLAAKTAALALLATTTAILAPLGARAQSRPDLTDTMGGVVEACPCTQVGAYDAYRAFDNNVGNSTWLVTYATMSKAPGAYLIYGFPGKVVIDGYKVYKQTQGGVNRTASEWTLEGTDDYVSGPWTTIDHQKNQTNWDANVWGHNFTYATATTNSLGFTHWRFTMLNTSGAGDHVGIGELEFYGHVPLGPPHLATPTFTYGTSAGSHHTMTLNGNLDGGSEAGVLVAHGVSPDNLAFTNVVPATVTGLFKLALTGLEPLQWYYLTMVATNSAGRYELPAQASFLTRGVDITPQISSLLDPRVTSMDSFFDGNHYEGYQAFDHNYANRWIERLDVNPQPAITFTLPEKTVITGYGIWVNGEDRDIKTWRIEGTNNDKADWDVPNAWRLLDRKVNQPYWGSKECRVFKTSSTRGFTHIRLTIEAVQNHTQSDVVEIEYYGHKDMTPQGALLMIR